MVDSLEQASSPRRRAAAIVALALGAATIAGGLAGMQARSETVSHLSFTMSEASTSPPASARATSEVSASGW